MALTRIDRLAILAAAILQAPWAKDETANDIAIRANGVLRAIEKLTRDTKDGD